MGIERNAFRAVVALVGLVPVGGGLYGAIIGAAAFAPGPHDASLDSHVRYLSGLLLGVGLAFWTTLSAPEAHEARYRLLTLIVVTGGVARACGVVAHGWPDGPMTAALGVELIAAPLICLWQARLARRSAHLEPPRWIEKGEKA